MIYLDNAATTLIKPMAVETAMLSAIRTMASPGRGMHDPAMRASEKVYECREAAAEMFNVSAEKIVFTSNATHALNIAIRSLAFPGCRVLISGYEHNAVTRPLADTGADIKIAEGKIFDSEEILEQFRKNIPWAELVVCTYVSNVFGFILPIYEIAELCKAYGVPLIIDASQAAGILPIDCKRLGAAFVAMPGHKGLYGPQGTGILICGTEGKPLICGGSGADSRMQTMPEYLPDRLEAGTHNVCGIAGLLEGIRFVKEKGAKKIYMHENELLKDMADGLSNESGIELYTGYNGRQSGVLSVRFKEIDCEKMAEMLNAKGICVRSGLHCAPYAHRSAGTLETGTVRFSFSVFNTEQDIENCCREIKDLLH